MLLDQLTREIESWEADETIFIKTPLTQQFISRAVALRLIHQIIEIIQNESAKTPRPSVGFSFEDPANWVLSIVATQLGQSIAVPIPQEFTFEQISSFAPHLDFVLTDSMESAERLGQLFSDGVEITSYAFERNSSLFLLRAKSDNAKPRLALPPQAVAVIHTSGSTDNPKGVVIGEQGLSSVVSSMIERISQLGPVHYASILPMSLLLEHVLGVYLPILTKGSIAVLPRSVGCYTGTQPTLEPYFQSLKKYGANFSMLPPSFLAELRKLSDQSRKTPRDFLGQDLEFLATGGAPVDGSCLEYFRENDIEIYQGYGLSENSSVVAWNYPGPNILGSVGKPLTHNIVRINSNGQVEVSGNSAFLGYVSHGEFMPKHDAWINTGDTGYFDDDGRLYITGRDGNLIVLSSGRNVAPEWIETKFKKLFGVKDILLVGHGRPFLSARGRRFPKQKERPMLNADQAPYFHTCPRCGVGGLERLSTHAFCVNCNYEEIHSDELCVIPQWALDALKTAKPKSIVREIRTKDKEYALESAV